MAVERLSVGFPAAAGRGTGGERWVPVVREVSLAVDRGEMVGLVGESGAGKSVAALAVLGLVPPPGRVLGGRVTLDGEELTGRPPRALRRVRGGRIAMVFQDPSTALDPVFTIGYQIVEAIRAHRGMRGAAARREAARLLDLVAVPDASRRLDAYPHQLSGGQLQRAMIAMALAGRPELLIADEPTTALDVTVQAQILELLERLRGELGLAVLLITHDLAVVAESCDRVVVLYAGRVVEEAAAAALFSAPGHPYTRALLAALPRLGDPPPRGGLPAVPGRMPDPAALPAGCAFHPRCPEVMAVCRRREPHLYPLPATGHRARCFLHAPDLGGTAGAGAAPGEPDGSDQAGRTEVSSS